MGAAQEPFNRCFFPLSIDLFSEVRGFIVDLRDDTAVPELDSRLEFGSRLRGGNLVVGVRGILGSEGSAVCVVAVDSVCGCSALVPMVASQRAEALASLGCIWGKKTSGRVGSLSGTCVQKARDCLE